MWLQCWCVRLVEVQWYLPWGVHGLQSSGGVCLHITSVLGVEQQVNKAALSCILVQQAAFWRDTGQTVGSDKSGVMHICIHTYIKLAAERASTGGHAEHGRCAHLHVQLHANSMHCC